jgi:hypothetical protein
MTNRARVGATARLAALAVLGLLVDGCGDDSLAPPAGRDAAVDASDAQPVVDAGTASDLPAPIPDAASAKDVAPALDLGPALDVVTSVPDAPAAQDGAGTMDQTVSAVEVPQGQDLAQASDVPFSMDATSPTDAGATSSEAGSAIDAGATLATPGDFVDQLRQVLCADIDRCCGASAAAVKSAQGGCNASDWASVTATLATALGAGATWDGVAAASCIAGLDQKLAGPCTGPPLGNRTVGEALVDIRAFGIVACKGFINAGNQNIGTECGSHLECAPGLQCVTDLAPSVCAPLREAGDDCGGGVVCALDGLFCDEAASGTCLAVTTNGASCASGSQCADGICAGAPAVCTAVCR